MAVFLSDHSSRMETVSHVATYLGRHQIDSWYAPRDIPPGAEWDSAIYRAIRDSDALVLLFDASADSSKHIKREIQIADAADIPIRWLRLEDIEPRNLGYYLGTVQWIDWLDKRDDALDRLVRSLPQPEMVHSSSAPLRPVTHSRAEGTEAATSTETDSISLDDTNTGAIPVRNSHLAQTPTTTICSDTDQRLGETFESWLIHAFGQEVTAWLSESTRDRLLSDPIFIQVNTNHRERNLGARIESRPSDQAETLSRLYKLFPQQLDETVEAWLIRAVGRNVTSKLHRYRRLVLQDPRYFRALYDWHKKDLGSALDTLDPESPSTTLASTPDLSATHLEVLANVLHEHDEDTAAESWLRVGAQDGDVRCMLRLSDQLLRRGADTDSEQWLAKAAATNDPQAIARMKARRAERLYRETTLEDLDIGPYLKRDRNSGGS